MTNQEIRNRAKDVIASMPKGMEITMDNVITQSLFTPGGTLAGIDPYWIYSAINGEVSRRELEATIKNKFRHLSNRQLVDRINTLPDFKWDDEGAEIQRRRDTSKGKLIVRMDGNRLVIVKDEA